MRWIWHQQYWPNFEYDPSKLAEFEHEFHKNSGIIVGALSHLDSDRLEYLRIEILTQEAVSTSSIEGELLQRSSVQSSIRKYLGLKPDEIKIPPNAAGVSEMMVDVYQNFDKPLTHQALFSWHEMLMNGRRDLDIIGNYRQHQEPMQIVSGNFHDTKVFYEAPPSSQIFAEMDRFITWYNNETSNLNGISILVLAGIAHLYFELIHPFEDGNGRIGRALVEKVISQRLRTPALNSLAKIIDTNKKEYYDALQASNHNLDINKWLIYFSKKLLESQKYTIRLVGFLVDKAKFFLKYNDTFNQRQLKVLLRVFEEGHEGFKGGLSAANYQAISGASPATATRDLQELLTMNALYKTGELKHTRYFLNLESI